MKKKLTNQRPQPHKIMANTNVVADVATHPPVATDRVSQPVEHSTVEVRYTKRGKLVKAFNAIDEFLSRSKRVSVLAK